MKEPDKKQVARRKKAQSRFIFEELEPRVLLSADIPVALADDLSTQDEHFLQASVDANEFPDTASSSDQSHIDTHRALIFVDTDTPDYQQLLDDILRNQDATHHSEIVLLENNRDGIQQITETLSNRTGLDSVHLISHGSAGSVELGSNQLDFDTLISNADLVRSWGDAFAENGDLLVYGCDLAANQEGQNLVDALGRLTGADVAASDDTTGHASMGGDWELEYTSGTIDTGIIVSAEAQRAWTGSLEAVTAAIETEYSRVPLAFEQNVGQTNGAVDFIGRGSGYSVFLTEGEAVLQLGNGNASDVLHMDLVGSNADAQATGLEALPGSSNYLLGDNPDDWYTNVVNYANVSYSDVYAGIDVHYYGNQQRLEYDFVVDAGADTSLIRIDLAGASETRIAENGDLVVVLSDSGTEIRFQAPYSYQDTDSGRQTVDSQYVIHQDGTVGFELGDYDSSKTLVIDPILDYGTFFGSSAADNALDITVDGSGNAYITGYTRGTDFPTPGTPKATTDEDVFVTKLSADGTTQLYTTFLGGSGAEYGYGIEIDAGGNAYITGTTDSTDLPTVNAYQNTLGGTKDAFLIKLDSAGSSVLYSSYFGGATGAALEGGYSIDLDAAGFAYITGTTDASDLPTKNALDSALEGASDAYIAKFDTSLTGAASLIYSTYIGGDGIESGQGIVVDAAGNVHITGSTGSTNLTMVNAFDATANGGNDAYVVKLNSAGNALTYSTYLGGSQADNARGIDINSGGQIYITGNTASADFSTTTGAYNEIYNGGATDIFVARIDPALSGVSSLMYSTFMGGSNSDDGYEVAVDSAGLAIVTGDTTSADLPVTSDALDSDLGSVYDGFVAAVDVDGSSLAYLTYLGGSFLDRGNAVTVDSADSIYVAGIELGSPGFDGIPSPNYLGPGGSDDGFIVKLSAVTANQAPVNSVPGAQSTPQDTALVFDTNNGNAVSITDDSGNGLIEVTLTATNGTLSLNGGEGLATVGDEITTNTDAAYLQINVKAAMDASGAYVAVWQSDGQDGDLEGIFAQRYDANGAALGSVWQVNTETADDQTEPEIAMDAAGNFVITWQSYAQDKNNTFGVYAQRYAADGTALGGEFLVNTSNTTGNQRYPDIAMDSAGNFVIVWDGDGTGDTDLSGIYGQRFAADGTPLGGEFLINTEMTDTQWRASVDMNATGEFVVSWTSNLQDGSTNGVYAQRFDAAGVAQGSEFRVNVTTLSGQWDPTVALKDNGEFVIGWVISNDGNGRGVHARVFDAGGVALTGEIAVNTTISGNQYPFDIALTDDGGFIATWTGPTQDIYMQKFDWAGNAIGAEAPVNSTVSGTQKESTIASNANGDYVILWQNDFAVPNNGIYAQHYLNPDLTFSVGDGADDSDMTLTGTLADINVALDGLTFTPTPGYNGTATVTINTDDRGNSGSGGALSDNDIVNITVGTGDSPTTTGIADVLVLVDSVDSVIDLFAAFDDIQDPDNALSYTITNNTNSSLFTATPIDPVAGTLTLDYAPSLSGFADITVRATDTGGGYVETTFNVAVGDINDAPVNSVPGTQATTQDTALVFSTGNSNLISISDTDAGGAAVEVTLTATNGTATLGSTGGILASVGGESLVNSDPTGSQATAANSAQSVVVAPDGSYVITWYGAGPGDTDGIFARRFDADGTALTAVFRVNTTTTNSQTNPAIAMNSSGDFVIAWDSLNTDGDNWGTYAQRYDSVGSALGGQILVNDDYTTGIQSDPSVAIDDAGNFVVAWNGAGATDADGSWARRFDNTGTALGASFRLNTVTGDDQSEPVLAMTGTGEFVAVWQSRAQDAGMSYGIFGQRFDNAGNMVGVEFQINSTVMGHQLRPAVDMDSAGNFVVIWDDMMKDGSGTSIQGQLYDSSGTKVGGEFQANTFTSNNQVNPAVAMNDSGYVVTWTSIGQDLDLTGIYMQQYDAAGNTVGGETLINSTTTGDQRDASVAINDQGKVVVMWSGNGPGDAAGIFAQRYATPTPLTFTSGDGVADASMTFTGTISDINAALDGLAFTPTASFNGAASLQLVTDDQGNTGNGGALSDDDTIVINVGAGGNAPTDISLSNSVLNENLNTTGGYSVGTLSTTDVDALDTFTYTFVGGADLAKFTIGGASLDELILDDGVLNYELKNSYQVMVRTTDSFSNTFDETLTININDITGTVSGIAYADEGVTNLGAGVTISLLVNGVSVESVVTGAGGAYSFTKEAAAGDAVALYIDGDATYQGTTVTVSDGSDLSGIQVFANHIVIRNDNGGVTSNADLANALGGSPDPDIHYAVVGGTLIANGVGEEVLIPSGHTYTPGGNVSASNIKILGTVNGGVNTFTIYGDWNSTFGDWNADTSTVNLAGTGVLLQNTSATPWLHGFNNLVVAAAGQTTTMSSVIWTSQLTTGSGTLTDAASSHSLTLQGTGNVFIDGGGTLDFDSLHYRANNATQNVVGRDYTGINSLYFDSVGGTSGSGIYEMQGNLSANDVHIIINNDANPGYARNSVLNTNNFNFTAANLYLGVNGQLYEYAVFNAGSSIVNISGDVTVYASDANGTNRINAGSSSWTVSGNWANYDSFTAGASTVVLDGTGTLNAGANPFYNLTTGAASQVTTITSDLTVAGVLTIADSTGVLTDGGAGYDVRVTGTGTPFVNNGSAVIARNFSYINPNNITIIAAGGTYNVAENLYIAGSGTGSGTTYQLNGDLVVTGGLHVYATSFGVSILDTMSFGITADSLQISNSAFQVGFLYANNSVVDINGDVDFIYSVTTNVNLGSSDWSVYGNWTNTSNTFNAGTSTVNFDGVSQTLSGSTAFYNFTKIESSDDGIDSVLIFDNTATQTINGTLVLDGLDTDDRINLISDSPANQWSINLAAAAVKGTMDFLDVADSDASGSDVSHKLINPSESFNSGNNIDWFGNSAPTIGGTAGGQAVNDNATIQPFSSVVIGDNDVTETLTVTVTLDAAAKGVFSALNGFTDVGGGVYTFSGTAAASTSAIRGLTFDPTDDRVDTGSTETTTFTISVDDGIAAPANDSTTTVISTSMNYAPVVTATAGDTGTEDTDQVYTHAQMLALIGASDVDDINANLSVAISNVVNGTLALSGGTGGAGTTFTFTPTTNFVGNMTFDYQVSDDDLPTPAASAVGTATVTLSAVNDTPTVTATASDTGTEDTDQVYTHAQMLTLIGAGDVDDIDANLSVAISNVVNGSVALSGGTGGAGTTFTFTPTANFVGGMTFDYQVSDDESPTPATSAVGTATVTLSAVNDGPTMVFPGTVQYGFEDTPLVFSVANGNPISVGDVDAGSADLYIKFLSYNGGITLNGVSGLTFTTGDGVLDTDMEFTGSIADINAALDGLSFTPDAEFSGGTNFQMWVNDLGNTGAGFPQQTTRAALVSIAAVNDAPIVSATASDTGTEDINQAYTHAEMLTLIGASDVDDLDANLTIAISNVVNGSVALTGGAGGAGTIFTFTPTANYSGNMTFDYQVSDDDAPTPASSAVGTATVTLSPVNDVPVAVNDTFNSAEDGGGFLPPFWGVLVNDTDVDGDPLTAIMVSGISNGSLTLNANGSYWYWPDPDFYGVDSFTYKVNDGTVDSNIATVTINVSPVNDAPTVTATASDTGTEDTDQVYTHAQMLTLIGAGDVDDIDANLSVAISNVLNGTLALSGGTGGAGTTFTFTPTANFVGSMTFDYQVSDDNSPTPATSAVGTATVTLSAVNDTPTVTATASDTGMEDTDQVYTHAQMLTLIGAGDVDDIAANLSVAISNVVNGTLALSGGTGGAGTTFTFTPSANFVGGMTFDYQVSDDNSPTPATSAVGTATVTLSAVNDAPTVNATASDTGTEDTDQVYTHAQMLTLIGTGDVDDANANLSVVITNVVNGSVALSGGTGGVGTTFVFTPTADFVGNMTFDYQVQDDNSPTPSVSVVGTATITLSAINDAPIQIVPGQQSTPINAPLIFSSLDGNQISVSDPDGGTGVILEITLNATNGTLTLADTAGLLFSVGNGSSDAAMTFSGAVSDINTALNGMIFDPGLNYSGSAQITVITDDMGNVGSGGAMNSMDTVNVTVTSETLLPILDDWIEEALSGFEPTSMEIPEAYVPVRFAAQVTADESGTPGEENPEDEIAESTIASTEPNSEAEIYIRTDAEGDKSRPSERIALFNEGGSDAQISSSRLVQRAVQMAIANPLAITGSLLPFQANAPVWSLIESMLSQMDNDKSPAATDEQNINIKTATGVTVTLTAGYVSWLLRAGYLSASLLSVAPLWREFDPLPILKTAAGKSRKDKQNTETPAESDSDVDGLFPGSHRNDAEKALL